MAIRRFPSIAIVLLSALLCLTGNDVVSALSSPSPLNGYHFGATATATATSKKVTISDLRKNQPKAYVPDGLTEEQYRKIRNEELAATQGMNFGAWGPRFKMVDGDEDGNWFNLPSLWTGGFSANKKGVQGSDESMANLFVNYLRRYGLAYMMLLLSTQLLARSLTAKTIVSPKWMAARIVLSFAALKPLSLLAAFAGRGKIGWMNKNGTTKLASAIAAVITSIMKSAIIASLIAGAAAFAPAQTGKASTSLRAFEDELGAQPPLGFFDPFGLLNGDVTQERFDRLRYVEIKHGRICQLAFLGQVVTRAGIHLPGSINYAGDSFDSFPNGVAALFGPNSIPTAGLVQMIAFVGFLECAVMRDVPGTGNEFVGDFRNGYIDFGWDDFDEETKLQKRAIELNNGRAAMMGILGLMVHEEIIPLGYDPDLPIIGHLQ